MALLRTEFGSVCSGEGGWHQLPRKQALNMRFMEFFMLLSEKVPSVPDKGFYYLASTGPPNFANFGLHML